MTDAQMPRRRGRRLRSGVRVLARAFGRAFRADLRRILHPLLAAGTAWRKDGVTAAARAFLQAQRDTFPLGLFAALLLLTFLLVLLSVVLLLVLLPVLVLGGGGML